MTEFLIRRAEPRDAEALMRIYASPGVIRGTLQLPFPSLERWRKRLELEVMERVAGMEARLKAAAEPRPKANGKDKDKD